MMTDQFSEHLSCIVFSVLISMILILGYDTYCYYFGDERKKKKDASPKVIDQWLLLVGKLQSSSYFLCPERQMQERITNSLSSLLSSESEIVVAAT